MSSASKLGNTVKQTLGLRRVVDSVSGLVSRARDAEPRWFTPFTWAAADGFYANDTEAWLFRQLPAADTGSDSPTIDTVLKALAPLGEGRQVQFVMHTWEGPPSTPKGTPDRLAAFLQEALRFPAPVSTTFVGVRLNAQPPAALRGAGALVAHVVDSVDVLLGESMPDFSIYDADRAAVSQALDSCQAQPAGRRESLQLESWYLLGVHADARATEYDDYVAFDGSERLELASVVGLSAAALPAALPAAGWRGATVVSARGVLTSNGTNGAALDRTSVIYGRRTADATLDWPTQLRSLAGVTIRPLPLRQLAALHETLPCSHKRLSPTLSNVTGATLARLGFAHPLASSGTGGLLVGMAGPRLTQPLFVPAVPGRPVSVIAGGPGSGKTVECEMLATQAALAQMRVLYVSGTPDAGAGVLRLVGGQSWEPSKPGDLTAFGHVAGAAALDLMRHLVNSTSLGVADREDLESAFRRAQMAGVSGFTHVLELAGSMTAVAQLRRALARAPHLQPFAEGASQAAIDLDAVTQVRLDAFSDPRARDLAVATVLARALAGAHRTMVVLDGVDDVLTAPATSAALRTAAVSDRAHVVVATRSDDTAEALTAIAGMVLVLPHDEASAAAGLRLAGAQVRSDREQWLSHAHPQTRDGLVVRPTLALMRTSGTAPASVLLGPWPAAALPALTRGAATGYAADE